MIFVGDIAVPHGVQVKIDTLPDNFSQTFVIANLEGALVSNSDGLLRQHVLFNGSNVIEHLQHLHVRVVSLANNHILDVHDSPSSSISKLDRAGILSCGAGDTIETASQPCTWKDGARNISFMSFGWKVIECSPAGIKSPGVNPLTPRHVLESVGAFRDQFPDNHLVLLMHWNFELELYPQPMHRELAFSAVECGASAVIGCHSHRAQGIEFYKGAPIVYGLGNWMLAQGYFMNGDLRFPSYANLQLAFDWDPEREITLCHWFVYSEQDQSLTHLESENVGDSSRVRELTPFQDLSHSEYATWFKNHRQKRLLLPVYIKGDQLFRNRLKDWWVRSRGSLINLMVKANLKHRRT